MPKQIIIFVAGLFLVGYPMAIDKIAMLYGTDATPRAEAAVVVPKVQEVRTVKVTAYSSTPDQTDDTPFTTAQGTPVRDGVLATNMLPFGTKVKIPALFGDKVFTVEDRMHPRKKGFVDVWMPTTENALRFGIHTANIVVLD